MSDLSFECQECDVEVPVKPDEAAVNIYRPANHQEIRFRCPICHIVQLLPIQMGSSNPRRNGVPIRIIQPQHDKENRGVQSMSDTEIRIFAQEAQSLTPQQATEELAREARRLERESVAKTKRQARQERLQHAIFFVAKLLKPADYNWYTRD